MAYLGYSEREQVDQFARGFSRTPLEYYPDETDGIGPDGRFLAMGMRNSITDGGLAIVFSAQRGLRSPVRILRLSNWDRAPPADLP